MSRILLSIVLTFIITGCSTPKNVLEKNGYFTSGYPFLYCGNPQIFDYNFIKFINYQYFSVIKEKVKYVTNVHGDGVDDGIVSMPMRCIGEFKMSDDSIYDFKITVSISKENEQYVESISFKKNEEKTKKYQSSKNVAMVDKNISTKSNRLCLGDSEHPERKSCADIPNDDVPLPGPGGTFEEMKRYEEYERRHQKYFTCRVFDSLSGRTLSEYVVADPRYCR